MATRKSAGTAGNLTDSKPKFLGIKLYAGESAKPGAILVRQRGTRILPGKNVKMGKDHTLFSVATGKVVYTHKRKTGFNGDVMVKKVANVLAKK